MTPLERALKEADRLCHSSEVAWERYKLSLKTKHENRHDFTELPEYYEQYKQDKKA